MNKVNVTGQTCVGDLRLSSLDIGFDLRLQDMAIQLPESFSSVGLDINGKTYLITGTRDEMVSAIVQAGYRIEESLS